MSLMRVLIIGGTRNLGPAIVQALLQDGHKVTVFNRGLTPDDLSAEVTRIRGDRTAPGALASALSNRSFDLVVDTVLYAGPEALATIACFSGQVGRYIFLSTGQVYLVRTGLERPFREEDYPGPVMPRPSEVEASDVRNWLYGVEKRDAEDAMADAWRESRFPFTSLRLPMVNSERDSYNRIYGYWLRLQDGGPILVPEDQRLMLRHVYGGDVVQAVMRLASDDRGEGQAYNIGQDEVLSLEEFLRMLADYAQRPLKLVSIPRADLDRANLLPYCSPFSDPWMSALDNSRSKRELGMAYTSLEKYLKELVAFFQFSPRRTISGYACRPAELAMAASRG
jgi:nucleoside-diphosphate-sugar epimerase